MTHVSHKQPKTTTVFGHPFGAGEDTSEMLTSTPTLLDFVFRDHREVILVLLYFWNGGPIPHMHSHVSFEKIEGGKESMGSVKVLWQTLVNLMECRDEEVVKQSLEAWPTA